MNAHRAKLWRRGVVLAGITVALLSTAAISKSACAPTSPFLASGAGALPTYIGSAAFVAVGLGHLLNDAVGALCKWLGLEPDFRSLIQYKGDTDIELSGRERIWVGYPVSALFGAVGLRLWMGVNGCDVVVLPMKGIPA